MSLEKRKKAKISVRASFKVILKVGNELPGISLHKEQGFVVGLCDLELLDEAIYCGPFHWNFENRKNKALLVK